MKTKTFYLLPFSFFLLSACQQKMATQPSYRPDAPSTFFSDGRAARPLPPGTVARGHLRVDTTLFTGKRRSARDVTNAASLLAAGNRGALGALAAAASEESNDVDTFPFPVTQEVLQQGQNRYMIYCVVCHDPLGTGRGKIVERGYTPPPSYHIERLRQVAIGHFFDVITNGYGSMPDYRQQVPPRDRWAIVAYIRALQLSQHYPAKELTPAMRQEMQDQLSRGPSGGPSP